MSASEGEKRVSLNCLLRGSHHLSRVVRKIQLVCDCHVSVTVVETERAAAKQALAQV